MTLNSLLIQLVGFTCLFMLVQPTRFPIGWGVAAAVNLVVLAIAFVQSPDLAGWISGAVWGISIFLPLIGYGKVARLVSQERYRQARRMAKFLRWLHPADGMVAYPVLLRGLELGQQGRLEEAAEMLSRQITNATSMGRTATALSYRLGARWQEMLIWANTDLVGNRPLQDPSVAAIYLRSLGETGDLNRLLHNLGQIEGKVGRTNTLQVNLLRLYALAFCGCIEPVQQLLQGALSVYPEPIREYWIATAELAAGHQAAARERLRALHDRSDAVQQLAISWRLVQPWIDPQQTLTAESWHILAQITAAVGQDARYGSRRSPTRKIYATYSLVAANGVMFAVEIFSGASLWGNDEDLVTLYRLGALVPEAVAAGEWWRSLSAIFLHAGIVHLLANMLGLLLFGALVEGSLGARRFLVCYLFSGIGSMLAVTAIALFMAIPDQMTVGASGAIMGMVGAEGAILLQGWRSEKAPVAGERLRLILVVIGLQLMSDVLTPQVSIAGHLSGLIFGFITGLLLLRFTKE